MMNKELEKIKEDCSHILWGCELNYNKENKKKYDEIFKEIDSFVKSEEDKFFIKDFKLECITGFCGTMNQDFTDFIRVLQLLNDKPLAQWQLEEEFNNKYHIYELGGYFNADIFTKRALNTIYCVLETNELIEYGTSLQSSWITDLGRDVLIPSLRSEEWIKFITKNSGNIL